MTNKHKSLLKEFKSVNSGVTVVDAQPLVGEPHAKYDGVAIKVTLANGSWLRVYRVKSDELNWY